MAKKSQETLAERAGLRGATKSPRATSLDNESIQCLEGMLTSASETTGPDSPAAERIRRVINSKSGSADATPATKPQVRTIKLEIPLCEPPPHVHSRRVNGNLHCEYRLDAARSEALRHLFAGMAATGACMRNGRQVMRNPHALLSIIDQLVEQIPEAKALLARPGQRDPWADSGPGCRWFAIWAIFPTPPRIIVLGRAG